MSRVRVFQAVLLFIIAVQVYDRNWDAALGWGCALACSRPGGIWKAVRR